uniref:Uncharacterized protein n=1 Tax=Ciona savignyi TaxID=51511 RepID=H2YKW0_CIOSA
MSGSSDNQQDSIKTDVGTKGIRLQGFKGFKLKGNCQLLIKSGLSQSQLKPSASLGDKIVLSPKQNVLKSPIQSPRKLLNVSPQKLSNASPQKLSISSPQKLISASPSKTNIFEILSERNEPIINEEIHKTK